jgi:putative CocE/NonD family hydrolase
MTIIRKALTYGAILAFITLTLLTVISCPLSAQTEPKAASEAKPEKLPAPLAGFEDQGKFRIYVNEEPMADIVFSWTKNGFISSTATLKMAGQSVTIETKIETDAKGYWTRISQASAQGKAELTRQDGTVSRTLVSSTSKETKDTIELKPGAVLFDNYGPALLSQMLRLYDVQKGGRQTFPIFVLPGGQVDAFLEKKGTEDRTVSGRDLKLANYLYELGGVDITIWADEEGKIFLASVPAQGAHYVRDGYEDLMKAAVTDPLLSTAKYDVVEERNVMVPMRDGVKLATDIFRPKDEAKAPVIFIRTPYKKDMVELESRYFARRGYACAVQDCRGRFSSQGVWEPFVNEPQDGHDAIEWLAAQPWSTGKVGMIGGSYVGWVQWWAAREKPAHLITIIPNVSPPDPFYNIPYEYGVFFTLGAIWWADILESEATADLSGAAIGRIGEKKYGTLLRSLPVIDLDKTVLGKVNPYWRKWIDHPTDDSYWERANFLERLKEMNIPAFHQSGWFDGDGIGSKLNYLAMKAAGHPSQKLIIGPWGHQDKATRKIGDLDFGSQALLDLPNLYLRWFDYWLKGIENGILKEPLVKIFVMGSNKWLDGDVYPLPFTQMQKWYLASGGKANTSKGNGTLSPVMPPAGSAPDTYVYDPGDPTPNPDFYEESEQDEKRVRSVEEKRAEAEAHHENVASSRPDILVYQTQPLEKPLTFAGPVSAVLYASSSARDTDWFMRLVWIKKDGKVFPLGEGKIRARFRKSMKNPEFLKAGEIYEYALDLWQTGITIPAGDAVRVEVASASFPLFSRNLNTGGHNETETRFVKADQTVFHDPKYPSHLLLPVIPEDKLK